MFVHFPVRKNPFRSLLHSSIVLSVRATENALAWNRTQDIFLMSFEPHIIYFWPQEIRMHKFGANQYIRSRAISVQTQKPTISDLFERVKGTLS